MPYVEISPEEVTGIGKFIPISEEEANKVQKPPSIWSRVKELPQATGETILSLGTGLAAYPIGLAAQGEALALGYSPAEARKIREFTSELYTYKPFTEAGQKAAEAGGKVVSIPFYPAEKGREYAVEKLGSDVGETVGLGLEAATIAILGGLHAKLKGKTKPTTFPTEAEWGELKEPKVIDIAKAKESFAEFKEGVAADRRLALPPGQGFIILDKEPKTILREKPPGKGKEVLIKEGEPVTAESLIPEELKTKVLPPGQGFIILDEPPKTVLRQPPPPRGKPVEISPEGEPIYPEGVKPVLMKAPVITKEGETEGSYLLPKQRIGRAYNRFKEWWSPFSTLAQKQNLLKIRGEALGGIARAERMVDHVIKRMKILDDRGKKDIFEVMDGRKDINSLTPDQRALASEFTTVNDIIGKMLVQRDLITQEAYTKLKGEYIKYAYLKHIVGDNVEVPVSASGKINTNALKARKGLTLEQQKAIGLIEDVSIAQPLGMAQSLTNIVKYDYLEKLANDNRNVWEPSIVNISDLPRKYSTQSLAQSQATRLSRTTGDQHQVVRTGGNFQIRNMNTNEWVGKKMGIGELYEEVELYKKMVKANPNSPEIRTRLGIYEQKLEQAKQETQDVPKDFIQMPTSKSWGPLAGTFLRKEIARDLMSFYGKERGNISGLTRGIDAIADIDMKATGLFKLGKVVYNLPTVVRNCISNIIQLNMSGMNIAEIGEFMGKAGSSMLKKDANYSTAFRNGLFKTNWSVTEINEVMNQFRELKGDTFGHVISAVKKTSKYYGKIDDFYKHAKFLEQIDKGVPVDKAIQEAQKWGMDYSLADPSIKWARKHFIPFASYQYKIAPLVVESAIKRPWVIAKYMALPTAMFTLAKELHKDEMKESDWEDLKRTIPREVQDRGSFLLVPWKIQDKWYWFDYSYFLPWGNYMNAIQRGKEGDIKGVLSQFGIGGTPLFTVMKTFGTSTLRDEPPRDSFSGTPLYKRIDEPIDKALKVSEYFWNLFAPSMVTRYGAMGYTFDIGKEDRYGRVVPAEQAIGRWFGVNLNEANSQLTAIVKKAKINALKDEYMSVMLDPKISSDKKDNYAKRFQEEIQNILEEK